eukprot:ANDGO_04864.mRNA.1 Putative acyltransferase Rv0859
MPQCYIVSACRTPIAKGRKGGALSEVHPIDLLAQVLDAVVNRASVDKSLVQDVVCGVVSPVGEQGANIPRLAALRANFPDTVAGVQINRMCGSSEAAIHFAAQAILAGDMKCVIACGVESMSRVPMGSDSGILKNGKPDGLDCTRLGSNPGHRILHQGVSAEMIAEKYGLTRLDCDNLASLSHQKAYHAIEGGRFASQIVPIKTPAGIVDRDEGVRYPSTIQDLAKLKTVFKKDGVVTAGNASQISDGASAVLLMSDDLVDALGLPRRFRLASRVTVGSDPELMLTGVIPATEQALQRAGISIHDVDVVEANEAFASVVLAWSKHFKFPSEKLNPNGGAIALGHPLGASGAVLCTRCINELERTGKRWGLVTLCIGFGMGVAMVIENEAAKTRSRL